MAYSKVVKRWEDVTHKQLKCFMCSVNSLLLVKAGVAKKAWLPAAVWCAFLPSKRSSRSGGISAPIFEMIQSGWYKEPPKFRTLKRQNCMHFFRNQCNSHTVNPLLSSSWGFCSVFLDIERRKLRSNRGRVHIVGIRRCWAGIERVFRRHRQLFHLVSPNVASAYIQSSDQMYVIRQQIPYRNDFLYFLYFLLARGHSWSLAWCHGRWLLTTSRPPERNIGASKASGAYFVAKNKVSRIVTKARWGTKIKENRRDRVPVHRIAPCSYKPQETFGRALPKIVGRKKNSTRTVCKLYFMHW